MHICFTSNCMISLQLDMLSMPFKTKLTLNVQFNLVILKTDNDYIYISFGHAFLFFNFIDFEIWSADFFFNFDDFRWFSFHLLIWLCSYYVFTCSFLLLFLTLIFLYMCVSFNQCLCWILSIFPISNVGIYEDVSTNITLFYLYPFKPCNTQMPIPFIGKPNQI